MFHLCTTESERLSVNACMSVHAHQIRAATSEKVQLHPAGRARTSDWSVNSFIMVVYEKFSVQSTTLKMSS